MNISVEEMETQLKTFGFIFEQMCARDLRAYTPGFGNHLSYYRDRYGLEADLVLHLDDGRYALIECKLGSREIEEGAKHLLEIKRQEPARSLSILDTGGMSPRERHAMTHSPPPVSGLVNVASPLDVGRTLDRLSAALTQRGWCEFVRIDHAAAAGKINKDDIYDLHLMTAKPFIYVFNVDDNELANKDLQAKLAASVAPAPAVFLNAQFEADLTELDEADAREMLEDAGLSESGLDQLARVGFDILGLQTFLTAGVKEVRAWQIHKGWTAPQAAGVIHTDFEKGFIKADIVSYDDFVAADGSMAKIKEEGKLRQEGRDYVMADGDIVEFKFNISK